MPSELEKDVCRSLRSILEPLAVGDSIPHSDEFHDLMAGFEWWLPCLFGEVHPYWTRECLDGVVPWCSRKTGDNEVEILGYCYLMSDQAVTPVHLRLRLDESKDEADWLDVSLGEKGADRGGLARYANAEERSLGKRLARLVDDVSKIEWAYGITFGEERRE